MSRIHSATTGSLVRELADAVRQEIAEWTDIAVSQAAGIHPADSEAAARFAIADVMTDVHDHVGIRLSVVLATYGITANGPEEQS